MAQTVARPPGTAVATTTGAGGVASDGLKRDAGFLGLLFTSEGSIIGSGWLFGALVVSTYAGPAGVIAWLIGSVAVILLALVHAELGGLFPVTGGTARFPHYAFGNLAGASFGWFSWLQAAGTAPIEVEAALEYSSNYVPGLEHTVHGTTVLTLGGYFAAAGLMALFTILNLYGIRRLLQANNAITTWKVVIPTLTILVLAFSHFDTSNFTSHGFAPYGTRGVLTAVSLGGAVFSLVGFEQAVQLGGESRNPQRDIPRAVIWSMVIGATLYLLLQIVFIGALPHGALDHGWHDVHYADIYGPFAGLAKGLGLTWLAYILYADAIVAPVGTGLVYTTTSSRLTYGMSKNGHVPAFFEKKTKRTEVPYYGLIFAFLVGLLLFLPFPSWEKLVGFITDATVLMYAGAPLALGALRRQKPDLPRPFRLRAAWFWGPAAFIAANWIVYWSGWDTNWKLYVAVILGYVLMGISRLTGANPVKPPMDWTAAIWLWPYLAGMALISYLGQFGGHEVIPFYWDLVVVAAWSVIVYFVALRLRLPADRVDDYARDVYPVED
jgi:amino acid transporter